MIGFLFVLLFFVIFGAVQSVMYLKYDTTPSKEAMKLCEQMSDGEISTEAAIAAIINRYSSRRMKHNV